MSNTPRTDAEAIDLSYTGKEKDWDKLHVPVPFARQLETELEKAKSEYVRDVLALNQELAELRKDNLMLERNCYMGESRLREAAENVVFEAALYIGAGPHKLDSSSRFRVAMQKLTDILAINPPEVKALRDAIGKNKLPMIGTMMFQPTGARVSFPIDDETAHSMIDDQYGRGSEVAIGFPHCDNATVSVRAGMITFLPARIA